MDELEQNAKQKTHEEVTAQLGRITRKLAVRALDSKVATEDMIGGVPESKNPLFADHYDGDDGQTSISHTQVGEENNTTYSLSEVRDATDEDGNKVARVEASKVSKPVEAHPLDSNFENRVFINSHPRTPGNGAVFVQGSGSDLKRLELSPEQEVIAAARIAGHLRGEVAAREIEAKNLIRSADEFINSK